MKTPEFDISGLPDPESAERFASRMAELHPSHLAKLRKKPALFSDVLTLVSYSPLIATTLLQNPEYIWWLERERESAGIGTKEQLLESLARFFLTNSQVPPNVLLARFRRRELMRIFLADIRRLLTIVEITEAISNLADAILENALRHAVQELQNQFGSPLESDEKGRKRPASFAVVSLGKLGSRELNYSSDIDLLFLYSGEGTTSATGTRESLTNREYFSKLAEKISRLVGSQTGEGAAYRVDLRLRPHGRVGPLAMSAADTAAYYRGEARDWERQVLIRSRASAGTQELFHDFFSMVEPAVYSAELTANQALAGVRNSKHKIDVQHGGERAFDIKLGRGGIREIEFIAQALQIAYGAGDKWLRAPHTLVSLSRLADRGLLSETELTELYDSYNFLRRLEHILQMENGLQTHAVPIDPARRLVVARRSRFDSIDKFDAALLKHTASVRNIFERIFSTGNTAFADGRADAPAARQIDEPESADGSLFGAALPREIQLSLEKSDVSVRLDAAQTEFLKAAAAVSRRIAEIIAGAPHLIRDVPGADEQEPSDYAAQLMHSVENEPDFGSRISGLRKAWSKLRFRLMVLDAAGKLPLAVSKQMQTRLAEAGIAVGLWIAAAESSRRTGRDFAELPLAVMGLGKLGSGGIDFDSDLDLILVSGDRAINSEIYAKAAEHFVTALSSVTREGSLYRIDLRLRPHGRNGPAVIDADAFENYIENNAAIWELLAFVKLRAAGGSISLGTSVESRIRNAIHRRALAVDSHELISETRRIRLRLERERSSTRNSRGVDIKFDHGGMLDIYFAVRFLQLRDNVPDEADAHSTGDVLTILHERGSLLSPDFEALMHGYKFLSSLDHELRLTIGRTTRLPHQNHGALPIIARRLRLPSPNELLQNLALHRIEIRRAFDRVLGDEQ